MTWVIGSIIAFFVLRFLWRSYVHPANVMTRQAANMNWVAIGKADNPKGGKDVLLGRGGLVSQIDWRIGEVRLVKPLETEPFADYIALERWLTLRDKEARDTAEAYIREKNAFGKIAKAQENAFSEEKSREGSEPKNADMVVASDELYEFMIAVQKRLRDGPGGDLLHEIDESFRLTSPEYMRITTELFQMAVDIGKSPTEVATYLIMAFAAANEERTLAKITSVIVYLRGVIDYLRSSD
ncbi:MAG: hypothetical protein AB3X44_08325 [Leptothrix sp. (in: b-proteobacteria)]